MTNWLKKRISIFPSKADSAYDYFAKRYGIGYGRMEVECAIRPDGSAQVQRTVQVEAHSVISKLDTFLLIPDPPPRGEEWDIDLIDIRSLTPDRDISLMQMPEQDGKQSVVIAISPQLDPGQFTTYQMVERLPPRLYAINFTQEELQTRSTPNDYFGWTINRPTRKFSLQLIFPEDTRPNVYGLEVRYASAAPGIPSEFFQHEEQKRLEKRPLEGPEGGRYSLRLDVDYPMIGLIYILSWKPLPKPSEEITAQQARHLTSKHHNTSAIHNLVVESFTPQELKRFCRDRALFAPILGDFGPGFGLTEMADTLIQYCQTREVFPELLAEIRAIRPRKYARYQDQLHKSATSPGNTPTT